MKNGLCWSLRESDHYFCVESNHRTAAVFSSENSCSAISRPIVAVQAAKVSLELGESNHIRLSLIGCKLGPDFLLSNDSSPSFTANSVASSRRVPGVRARTYVQLVPDSVHVRFVRWGNCTNFKSKIILVWILWHLVTHKRNNKWMKNL